RKSLWKVDHCLAELRMDMRQWENDFAAKQKQQSLHVSTAQYMTASIRSQRTHTNPLNHVPLPESLAILDATTCVKTGEVHHVFSGDLVNQAVVAAAAIQVESAGGVPPIHRVASFPAALAALLTEDDCTNTQQALSF